LVKENGQLRVHRYNLTQTIRNMSDQKCQLEHQLVKQNRQIRDLLAQNAELIRTQEEAGARWTELETKLRKIHTEHENLVGFIQELNPINGHNNQESVANDNLLQ